MLELVINKEKYFAKQEAGFLKYLHKKNGTKLTKENLTFSFFDLEGKGYYKFPKDLSLPLERLGKLQEYMIWLSKSITSEEEDKFLDVIDKAVGEGLKNVKHASKIGWATNEMRDRKKMIVHPELFYNIIAIQIIRDDESPTKFNNEIQMQKVEAFKRLDSENDTFFLHIQEYLAALNWSNISREELINILNNSTIRLQATEKMLADLFGNLSPEMQASLGKI